MPRCPLRAGLSGSRCGAVHCGATLLCCPCLHARLPRSAAHARPPSASTQFFTLIVAVLVGVGFHKAALLRTNLFLMVGAAVGMIQPHGT